MNALKKFEHLGLNTELALYGMVDIVFAYCYENRIMNDDLGSESGITINKLSSLLSCHIIDEDFYHLIKHSYKRALSYPLIRHYSLAEKSF